VRALFPAVGLLVGGIGALVYWLALRLAAAVAVLLSMAATICATGAFHEDGLSDTADGLGGGWDKARILAIMKDSRVGSYGVVALVLALLGKFALLSGIDAALVPAALLAGHAVSRLCATLIMATLDYARDDESSKARPATARPSLASLLLAAGFAAATLRAATGQGAGRHCSRRAGGGLAGRQVPALAGGIPGIVWGGTAGDGGGVLSRILRPVVSGDIGMRPAFDPPPQTVDRKRHLLWSAGLPGRGCAVGGRYLVGRVASRFAGVEQPLAPLPRIGGALARPADD
jgi:cobalamin synthase